MGNQFAALLLPYPSGKLAESIGVKRVVTISRWKSGEVFPAPEFYDAISRAIGMPVSIIAQAIANDRADRLTRRRAAAKIA